MTCPLISVPPCKIKLSTQLPQEQAATNLGRNGHHLHVVVNASLNMPMTVKHQFDNNNNYKIQYCLLYPKMA